DFHVTGVQTCALPISLDTVRLGAAHQMKGLIQLELTAERMVEDEAMLINAYLTDDVQHAKGFWREFKDDIEVLELEVGQWLLSRSEERRVGKEGRCRR